MKVLLANVRMDLGGGTDLVGFIVAETLRRNGYDVELRTVEPSDPELVRRRFPGMERIPETSVLRAGGPEADSLRRQWSRRAFQYTRLLVRLWSHRAQSVIVDLNGDIVPAPAHLTLIHFPLAASAGERGATAPHRPYGTRIAKAGLRVLGSVLLHTARPRIVANSHFTRRAVWETFRMDSEVVFPPVKLFLPPPTSPVRGDVVVTVASFRSRKRLERIVEIAERLPAVTFKVFGTRGPDGETVRGDLVRRTTEAALAGRLTWTVDAPREDLERALWSSKVYLHPTPAEHFGISAVEGMMAGCVPVVPRSGGQWEDVLECQDGRWGFGYDTAQEAAGAIGRLMSDDQTWRRMSERARERAQSFSEDAFARRFMSVFREVLKPVR